MKRLNLISFSIVVGILSCWFSKTVAQRSLQSYIDTALKNNPALQVYSFKSKSLEQQIKSAGAWDDPMFFVGVENVPVNFSFSDDEMTMKRVGFQQNFSLAGKYSLKGKVAEKEFEASRFNTEAQKRSLIFKIKEQYYDLYVMRKAIEATRNSIEIMTNFISVANTRYSTGKGTQQDELSAQIEVTKMQGELLKMESELSDMIAIFNSFLNRDKMDSVETPAEINFIPIQTEMSSLLESDYQNNPILLGAQVMIAKDSADFLLAKTSKSPDFNIGAYYGQRQYRFSDGSKAMDMFGVMLNFTLPVWSRRKQSPMIAQANINIQKSQSEYDAMQNEIELMIHHAIVDAQKNEKLISLYSKQLIPQATENLNAGITGYQQNKIDFMTLTDNLISLYNYKLQYHQAVADYMKAIAELEMLTGKNLIRP